MPKTKRPVDPAGGPVAALAHELQKLREATGKTYDELAALAHYGKTTLATADTGRRLPTWDVVMAYVTACGGDVEYFRRRWREVVEQTGRHKLRRPANHLSSLVHRPDRVVDPPPVPRPDPTSASTLDAYRVMLNDLRAWAGNPTYRQLCARAGERKLPLARSTLHEMLAGHRRLIARPVLTSYLLACGLDAEQVDVWLSVHRRVERSGCAAGPVPGVVRATPGTAQPVRHRQIRRTIFVRRTILPVAVTLLIATLVTLAIVAVVRPRPGDPGRRPPAVPAVQAVR